MTRAVKTVDCLIMKRTLWVVGLALAVGGCYFDGDRRREIWQREQGAVDDLCYQFDHYFIEPR